MIVDEKYLKEFIRSAINQRQILLDNRGNRKNKAQAANYIKVLKIQLDMLNHSPHQLALFFLRNFDKIIFLLPPKRYEKAMQIKSDLLTPKLF